MGYTVLPNPPAHKPVTISQEPVDLLPPQALPTAARPVEAYGKPEEVIPGESLPALRYRSRSWWISDVVFVLAGKTT